MKWADPGLFFEGEGGKGSDLEATRIKSTLLSEDFNFMVGLKFCGASLSTILFKRASLFMDYQILYA